MNVEDNLRVLLVEDAPDVALMLKHFFEGEGCRVETAGTGAEALSAYWRLLSNGDPCGLILLDVALPGEDGMDGLAVARRIRTAEREAGRREVYLCGYTAHEESVLAPGSVRRAGLDRFLVKSASVDEMAALRDVLHEAMEKRKRPLGQLPGGAEYRNGDR